MRPISAISPAANLLEDLPLRTVYGLYRSWHARGYSQSDLHRVFDFEKDAHAAGTLLQRAGESASIHCRHYYYVAKIKCVARLWLVMYQECHEGAITIGICRSSDDAVALKAKIIDDPEKYIGSQIDPEDVFIEESVLR